MFFASRTRRCCPDAVRRRVARRELGQLSVDDLLEVALELGAQGLLLTGHSTALKRRRLRRELREAASRRVVQLDVEGLLGVALAQRAQGHLLAGGSTARTRSSWLLAPPLAASAGAGCGSLTVSPTCALGLALAGFHQVHRPVRGWNFPHLCPREPPCTGSLRVSIQPKVGRRAEVGRQAEAAARSRRLLAQAGRGLLGQHCRRGLHRPRQAGLGALASPLADHSTSACSRQVLVLWGCPIAPPQPCWELGKGSPGGAPRALWSHQGTRGGLLPLRLEGRRRINGGLTDALLLSGHA